MLTVCGKTDIGLVRNSNQDACRFEIVPALPDAAWSVVCDGMGGANGGNVASAIAVETISQQYSEYFQKNPNSADNSLRDLMLAAVYTANKAVFDRAKEEPELVGMGTTVVTAIVAGGTAHLVHAGDSRAYLLTPEGVQQITTDHSMVQEMVDSGDLTPEQAKSHPQRNIITRALGVEDHIRADYCELFIPEGKFLLLLCTDGFSNCVEPEEVLEAARHEGGEALAEHLIEAAKTNGGSDNITVAIIQN